MHFFVTQAPTSIFWVLVLHKHYRIDPDGIATPTQLTDYLNAIEIKTNGKLDEQQRAWYVRRTSTL